MVVKCCEMFLKLKGRVELQRVVLVPAVAKRVRVKQRTSPSGIRGGPAAMSSDLVPGCMRRFAFASVMVCSICCA